MSTLAICACAAAFTIVGLAWAVAYIFRNAGEAGPFDPKSTGRKVVRCERCGWKFDGGAA